MQTTLPDAADTNMLAVVCHGPRDYRLERVARPQAGPRELVIRVASCGICAGDCKCWAGAPRFWGDPEKGRPAYVRPPVIADRKSTRLNSSHQIISYAVFCLKKKKNNTLTTHPRPPQP